MCVVSMVVEGLQQQYPVPVQFWPPPTVLEVSDILKRLDAIDKKLGLRDCDDADKIVWRKQLDERVKALEREMPKRRRRKVKA